MIFLADTVCCKVTPATVAEARRLRQGRAPWCTVTSSNLNDDVASRWGPRLGVLVNELTAAVKSALGDPKLWK